MTGASNDPHDRRGVTAGWASTNRLPAGVVSRMGDWQRDALLAALKKTPPPEPTTRRHADGNKDKELLAMKERIVQLEAASKRAAAVSRERSQSRGRGGRVESRRAPSAGSSKAGGFVTVGKKRSRWPRRTQSG